MIEFKLDRLSDYSDNSILEEIRRVANILKEKPLTITSFDKESRVNHTTITRRFGSWKNALKEAGLENRYSGKSVTKKQKEQISKKMTDEDLISELKRIANLLDQDFLTRDNIEQNSSIGTFVLQSRFGSLRHAIESAGLKIVNHAKRYSDEERYENLLNVWTHYGRQPKYAEMKSPPSTVGPKAYLTRWGSWSKALHAFVDQVNKDLDEQENTSVVEQKVAPLKKQTTIPDEDRREIKLGLRYKILSRDYFKCKRCGDSPATNPACKLHVDHIVPFSRGGKTTPDNLQTLCDKCNIGKGNRYAE